MLTYETAVRLQLAPALGRVPLARLTPSHVETCLEELRENGTSASRIRYARNVLRAALNRARK